MLTVQQVTRAFDGVPVLRGIDLDVQAGEIVCLLGPSGCGKTTLLRVIAGLEQADGGEVIFDGDSIMPVPVHTRDFGLMFQDFALFPHMNVAQNVTFGLRMRHVSPDAQEKRLREVLRLVGLEGFARRDVGQLSGGERQRVALARSIAPNPRLLMLDEPLGSLDAALRERLVVELRAIIKQVGLMAIYVTHDQHEAFAIADRIAIMNAGQIEQTDTPEAIYHCPKTVFVAQFLGLNNVVPVLGRVDGKVQTAAGDFAVAGDADAILLHPDGIRRVSLDVPDALIGTVVERVYLGDAYQVTLHLDQRVRLTFKWTIQETAPTAGERVAVLAEMVLPLVKG